MSRAIENLKSVQQRAMVGRPRVGGFTYLAETLRRVSVTRNLWSLPFCQSLYLTAEGPAMTQGTPLSTGMADVPPFNRDALIMALRTYQVEISTFPESLMPAWKADVIGYDVDFIVRIVTYYGSSKENYVESYPAVEV